MTIRGHLHPRNRYATLHLESAFPPALRNLEKSHHALQDRHFRLSAPRHARVSRKIQASRAHRPSSSSTSGKKYVTLHLNAFRGEPAITEFDWPFTPTHNSSPQSST